MEIFKKPLAKYGQPCPKCGSHDAVAIYPDGAYCFSCQTQLGDVSQYSSSMQKDFRKEIREPIGTDPNKYPVLGIHERGIPTEVCKFFNIHVSVDVNGKILEHYYPYDKKSWKVRVVQDKHFKWVGQKSHKLFGQDLFNPGRRLVICEGELDALSVAAASIKKYNKIYPVVAVPSSTDLKCLIENRLWLRQFEEIVLAFDADENGRHATKVALKMLGRDKCKVAKFPDQKDCNDILMEYGWMSLLNIIWDASVDMPPGIMSTEDLWKQIEMLSQVKSVPYPECLSGLNTKLKGMRTGEICMYIAGTSTGKSTIFREVILHLLKTIPDDEKVGLISLEESPAESVRKLCGMVQNMNTSLVELSSETLRKGFDMIFDKEKLVVLNHEGAIDDTTILEYMEIMCLMGCKYLFLDHITLLVAEGVDNLTGLEATDKIMGDFLRLVKRYPVHLAVISHLRKTIGKGKTFEEGMMPSVDDCKGSGSIKQIAFDIIAFTRNLLADSEIERNTIHLAVLKCRHTGITGSCGTAIYNLETGRLQKGDNS